MAAPELTIETFAPRVGQVFRVVVNDEWEIHMTLSEVARAGERLPGYSRVPFTLLFHAPEKALVPQQSYQVEHDELESFPLFLVPLGPDADGMRYEAVFT